MAQPHLAGVTVATAWIALLVNLFVPGVGSFFNGQRSHAVGQVVLFVVGIFTIIIVIGLFAVIAAWIWALVTSVQALAHAVNAERFWAYQDRTYGWHEQQPSQPGPPQ